MFNFWPMGGTTVRCCRCCWWLLLLLQLCRTAAFATAPHHTTARRAILQPRPLTRHTQIHALAEVGARIARVRCSSSNSGVRFSRFTLWPTGCGGRRSRLWSPLSVGAVRACKSVRVEQESVAASAGRTKSTEKKPCGDTTTTSTTHIWASSCWCCALGGPTHNSEGDQLLGADFRRMLIWRVSTWCMN